MFLLIVTNAWSQTSGTGSIQGIVTDPMDAVVPGARVTATNALTGVVLEATTTEAGRYVIPLLKPGPYNVTFTSAGFAVVTEKNIVVDALAAIAVNAKLSANTVSDVVTVTGEQAALQTEDLRPLDISGRRCRTTSTIRLQAPWRSLTLVQIRHPISIRRQH